MSKKRILSFILTMATLCTLIPGNIALADDASDKKSRSLYIHAQGENPTATVTGSTIFRIA